MIRDIAEQYIPTKVQENLKLLAFGILKVPMILFVRPVVEELTRERVVVRIPFAKRNRNHLNSMYFGALSVGADVAGGILALHLAQKQGKKLHFLFKDFKANFLKRPEGETIFTCEDGEKISAMVDEAIKTKKRVNRAVQVVATVPSKFGDEPVAKFTLTLSMKAK